MIITETNAPWITANTFPPVFGRPNVGLFGLGETEDMAVDEETIDFDWGSVVHGIGDTTAYLIAGLGLVFFGMTYFGNEPKLRRQTARNKVKAAKASLRAAKREQRKAYFSF